MRRTSSGTGLRARVEVAPAYELVLTMAAAASRGEGAAVRFASSTWMWAHLVTIVVDAPPPRDVPAFLAYLERVPALEVQRRLVGFYARWFRDLTPTTVMNSAIRGDASAVRAFLRTSMSEDPTWQESLRARLEAGAPQTKRDLLELLQTWNEAVFERTVTATMRALTAATRSRRRTIGATSAEELVSGFLGYEYCPEPGIARALVVPSLVLGREIHEFDQGPMQIFCVGIDEPARPTPRAATEVLAVSRALANESRLRILAVLSSRDLGAQEIADRVGLSLTTVLHHLGSLRDAGLVGQGGRRRAYRIRRAGLGRYASRLRSM